MDTDDPSERPGEPAAGGQDPSEGTVLLPPAGSTPPLGSAAPGSMLGPYRLEGELGRGGMGVVHRAHDTRLNRPVAVKMLPRDLAGDPERLTRFRREARTAARINHPNVATVHEWSESADFCLIAMELVEGVTLRQLMAPPNRLSPEEIVGLAVQITEGLSAAHEQGIVHRDLKPGNIMVTPQGRVKVLDFGLARTGPAGLRTDPDERTLTRQGDVMGTIEYMSPEQVRGNRVDPLSDLFSLGAVLFEVLEGVPPFHRAAAADTISAILHEPPAAFSAGRTGPPRLTALIGKLLSKDPSDRPASAKIVLEELRAVQGEASGRTGQPGEARPKRLSIAVLPLENLSGEPGQEYIADGMTDALINDLAHIGGLRVISRTSVMAYKGRYASIGELARELGVDFLVEGTVLHSGGRVRITAKLIRATTDEHLWGDRYDGDLRDVLALQSEVAQAIAKGVNVTLSPKERVGLAAPRQVDPEAYLLDLKGQQQLLLRNEKGFLKAMRSFEQAIAIDPTYAQAHVGLADTYGMLMAYGLMPIGEVRAAARAAIEKALKLDPDLAGAQRALALCQWQAEFDWTTAEETYGRAIERDPTAPLTVQWYAVFLAVTGRLDASLLWMQRARELDPLSLNIRCFYGWMLYFARRFEEAIPHFRQVLRIDPDHLLAHWFLGEALTELGEHEEAVEMLRRACELGDGAPRLLAYFGYGLGRAGRSDQAAEVLARLQRREKTDYVPPYFYALIHCGLGQTEEALAWLEKAVHLPDSMVRDLLIDVPLECVRPDPRYRDLLGRIGLDRMPDRPVDPPA